MRDSGLLLTQSTLVVQLSLAGLAGGCALAVLVLDLAGPASGGPRGSPARRVRKLALASALLALLVSGATLGRPERAWYLLVSPAGDFSFRPWSFPWLQAWVLLVLAALLLVALALPHSDDADRRQLPLDCCLALAGVLASAGVGATPEAGLLAGAALTISGAGMALAAIELAGMWSGDAPARRHHSRPGTGRMPALPSGAKAVADTMLVLVVCLLLATASPPALRTLLSGDAGLLLLVGALLLGALVPLVLRLRPGRLGPAQPVLAALLTLLGGVSLRAALVLAG